MPSLIYLVTIVLFICGTITKCNGVFITKQINPQKMWNATSIDKVRQDLLSNYDRQARPSHNNKTTIVEMFINMNTIDVYEIKSIVVLGAWIKMQWIDDKLKWDTRKYGGVDEITLAYDEVWKPDIALCNSPLGTPISIYGARYRCKLYFNGLVTCVPSVQLSVLCDLDLTYWPYDSHNCIYKFVSWTDDFDVVHVRPLDNGPGYHAPEIIDCQREWCISQVNLIRHFNIRNQYCSEHFFDMTFNITITRQSKGYGITLVAPALAVSILVLISFWLSINDSTKITINVVASIIASMFLIYYLQKIQAVGRHTPVIVSFYSAVLYMVSFSIMETTLLSYLVNNKDKIELPWFVKYNIGRLSRYLGINFTEKKSSHANRTNQKTEDNHKELDKGEKVVEQSVENPAQSDYQLLAQIIDRLFFCIYTLVYIILAIKYAV